MERQSLEVYAAQAICAELVQFYNNGQIGEHLHQFMLDNGLVLEVDT